MIISWKAIGNSYYAYLDRSVYDPQKKGPVSKSTYLGNNPEKAGAKLAHLVPDTQERERLIAELHSKRPAGKPPKDEWEKAISELTRMLGRYTDDKVRSVIQDAIKSLE